MTPFSQVEPANFPGCAGCSGDIVTQAILIDGSIVEYQLSSETKKVHQPIFWDYLGQGVVYSINGQVRRSSVRKHFWKRIS